ncbi:MAG: pseudouridine synthase [Gammaproteobacteria bacterium]
MSERIQKFLANQGIASRREIERWIKAGEVRVDGELCVLGQAITGSERIEIRGDLVELKANVHSRVIMYHKPTGEIVSRSDPDNRPTVFRSLPHLKTGRWVSVGRLDINTSGLLLLTTDGKLANDLMHPSNQIEREYQVRVQGKVTNEIMSNIQNGVQLEDGVAKLKILEVKEGEGANTWCRVVLQEGRNREVRRIWESQNLRVSRLVRTRYGSIELPHDMRLGKYLDLTPSQFKTLQNLVSVSSAK